jgi:hypothetical protein
MTTMTANGAGLLVPTKYKELRQQDNGREPKYSPFQEVGSLGTSGYGGYYTEAYDSRLYWPGVSDTYNTLFRKDPEVNMAKTLYQSLPGQQTIGVELPERAGERELGPPTDDDKRARDFVYEVLDDVEDGIGKWFSSCVTRVPLYGFGVWEAPFGLRRQNWKPPRPLGSKYDDPWRSDYDDGLTGYRRLAFRSYASFMKWEDDEYTGRAHGFVQSDPPNPQRTIPLDRCLHVRYGDLDNPEGAAALEVIYRLEYLKRAVEQAHFTGIERSAGYLNVEKTSEGATTDGDLTLIRNAARAVMSAQEGNYLAWPYGWKGSIIDTPFAAGAIALETIRYLGILKMATLGAHFIAMSTLSGSGSYAALDDSSSFALLVYNATCKEFIRQADDQLIKRLFAIPSNAAAFPNMTRRPRLTVTSIDKKVALAELGQFAQAMKQVMQLGDEDLLALRRKSDILPVKLPEIAVEEVAAVPDVVESVDKSEDEAEEGVEDMPGEMAQRVKVGDRCTVDGEGGEVFTVDETKDRVAFLIGANGRPHGWEGYTKIHPLGDMEMAQRVVASFAKWAEENEPETAAMLAREV